MLKSDICITIIGQAALEIFHFKVGYSEEKFKI